MFIKTYITIRDLTEYLIIFIIINRYITRRITMHNIDSGNPTALIDLTAPKWTIIICSSETYSLEQASVATGVLPFCDAIHLRDALNIVGRAGALTTFKRQGNKPLTHLVSSWATLAECICKEITIVEEIAGKDENSFSLRKLYCINAQGKALFFVSDDNAVPLTLFKK